MRANGTATNCESRREAEKKIQEGYCRERSSEAQSGTYLQHAELLIDRCTCHMTEE